MNTNWIFAGTLIFTSLEAIAQDQAAPAAKADAPAVVSTSEFAVAERGPHHRVWQRVTTLTDAEGNVTFRTNAYQEIETGMHYLEKGEWREAREEIEIVGDHAVARHTAHQVIFAPNLASTGVVDLSSPDGKHFVSHILGLSYFDSATGQAVLIAEPKESIGEVLPPNQLFYLDAFDDVRADVLYENSKMGLEQNIVLREQPPAPEKFGLDPRSTRLQVLTEFTGSPVPTQQTVIAKNGLTDEQLDFGAMQIGPGKAFSVGAGSDPARVTGVAKQWLQLEGRQFLVEEVRFTDMEKFVSELPKRQAALRPNERTGQGQTVIAALGPRLAKRTASVTHRPMQLAQLDPNRQPGFLLDYAILSSAGNFTFQGDTTYYVTNTVNLSGTTTIEGGTIIKVATNTTAKINLTGSVECRTGPYRPAVFTAKDDNTVGETIAGSTGTPAGYYGGGLTVETTGSTLHDMRLSYANKGVVLGFESGQINLANLQCVNCQYPVYSAYDLNTVMVDNSLFVSGSYVVYGGSGSDLVIIGRHLTVHNFAKVGPHSSGLQLTNSVVVGTSWGTGTVTADHTVYFTTDPDGIFQTVGAASHYLVDGSTNRDAGTTDIPASLLADLAKKTTYPPYEITTNITGDTVLSTRGLCDTNTPDCGYHYDILDYAVSGRTVSANLTLTNGVALGTYGDSSSYGLGLSSGSFVSRGTPTNLNWIVRYNTVQEPSRTNWSASTVAAGVELLSSSPVVSVRLTGWSLLAGVGDHCHGYASATTPCGFSDCQFSGGTFTMVDNSTTLTNCLWERVALTIDDDHDPMTFAAFNNLLRGGSLALTVDNQTNNWRLKDNFFNQTAISAQGAGTITHDYNGYVTNYNHIGTYGAHDVILANTPVFLPGNLGNYYYPTNDGNLSRLIDAGSRPVEDAWLFAYTVQTNHVLDACAVDIGFHYYAGASGDLIVSTDVTALQLAKLLLPAWVTNITNAKFNANGTNVARGTFTNGFLTGFPINYGVILSTGYITNAIGPNDDDGDDAAGGDYNYPNGPSNLGLDGDSDLSQLIDDGPTHDATVLEFDFTATNSFTLQFQYIFGSEEYPEWIKSFNDPIAIFVTTNLDGTNWVCNITNDLAVVPGMTNVPVSVSHINGGWTDRINHNDVAPTNSQYYVDNCDPAYQAATNAAPVPVYNLQYDGFTTFQTVQTSIAAYVTNHIKIAVADYGTNDFIYDSAIFIKSAASCQ